MEVGVRRARHQPLGLSAMTCVKISHCSGIRHMRYCVCAATLAAALTLTLSGCEVVSTVSGVAAGVASGTATGNPAVGAGIAIAVKAGVDEAGKTVSRRSQQAEQDAIVTAAGTTRVGETGTWQIRHRMTRAVEHGDVRVMRVIKTPLAVCKELLFS